MTNIEEKKFHDPLDGCPLIVRCMLALPADVVAPVVVLLAIGVATLLRRYF